MTEDLARGFQDTIKNYQIDGTSIIVNFIDGRTISIDAKNGNREKLEKIMVMEAQNITNHKSTEEYILDRKNGAYKISLVTFLMSMTGSLCTEILIGHSDERRASIELIMTLLIPIVVFSVIKSNQIKDTTEVKKYQLFLEHYEEFMSNQYSEKLYEGIHRKGYISINNLDVYSYREVKKMYDNIKNVRKRTNN